MVTAAPAGDPHVLLIGSAAYLTIINPELDELGHEKRQNDREVVSQASGAFLTETARI
jgi:hypothetical protein